MRFQLARTPSYLRVLRGRVASRLRIAVLNLSYPGADIDSASFVGPGCDIRVGRGSTLVLRGTHVSRGVLLEVHDGATMALLGPYIGPFALVVARERITIGPGSSIAEMTVLRDQDHERDLNGAISMHHYVTAAIEVGRDVQVAAHAVVLKGVRLGDRSTVAAGAVVVDDVPADTVVAGIPARPIKARIRTRGR